MNRSILTRCRMSVSLALLILIGCGTALAQGGGQTAPPAGGTAIEEPAEPAAENPTLTPKQETLAQKIFGELISPCCWTTTVASHGSGAAPRIQAEVRKMIAGGMTHQQILDRYVKQYGERILAQPKKSGFNLAAYWVPYLALALGAGAILATIRKRRMAPGAALARSLAGVSPADPDASPARSAGPVATAPSRPGSDEEYRRRIDDELRRTS
jgi:cytochrome c-type biogenesis protein CcmH/NrfF